MVNGSRGMRQLLAAPLAWLRVTTCKVIKGYCDNGAPATTGRRSGSSRWIVFLFLSNAEAQ